MQHNINLKSFFVVGALVLAASSLSAQNQEITVPYQFGFEEEQAAEFANWVFNPGTNASKCMDQWVIGEATHNDGHYALYISNNGGADAQFGYQKNVQYAYRDFTIAAGGYDICFDWRCLGVTLSNASTLYVGVAPASSVSKDMNADWQRGIVPSSIGSWCRTLGPLNGSSLWKNSSIHINSKDSTTYRLFFVWSNSTVDTVAMPLGACIDNIQITSDRCYKPYDITATSNCDSIWVSWKGTSTSYCFEYRRRGAKRWSVTTGIQAENYILEGLDEGLYDFRIRGVCSSDTSAYAYLNSYILFCPERHCINYISLDDSVNVTCSYGTYKDPGITQGVVNFGPEDKFSRHTVNWEPDMYDPRTCNELPTIPEGELASVRLGNWNAGGQGEQIEYRYTVDLETAAILLLKYAVVLEDPDHGVNDNPRFELEILGESGEVLDPTCGKVNFAADVKRKGEGWHACGKAPGASCAVSWKEWTTMGINLKEVGVEDGETIIIRLVTKDCAWSAHFGYAYFTLGCAAAELYGTSCGTESQLSVSAPLGFDYVWYNYLGDSVSNEQKLYIEPSDTTTYRCHLSYKDNPECGFDLFSSARPRFPIAEFTHVYVPSDCQNKVRFTNLSHIMTLYNNVEEHHYDEKCDEYEWDFGDGIVASDKNPVHVFPQEGGTFPITLRASIAEGVCFHDTTVTITIPAIGDSRQVIDSTICDGGYVVFGKYYAGQTGEYENVLTSQAGCDSVMVLNLKVNPVSKTILSDTIVCAEEPLCIDGDCYKHHQSGTFVRYFKNTCGCDSTVWMEVTMLDSLKPIIQMRDITTAEEYSGAIFTKGTGYSYYTLNGTRYEASDTIVDRLNGGPMELVFYNDWECSVDTTLYMNYPCRNMIFQRWNDVLSVYNQDAQTESSPGREPIDVVSCQWLKNGTDIPGATKTYYFEEGGLDLTATYQVRIISSDGTETLSCEFMPSEYTPKQAASGPVKVLRNSNLYILVGDNEYNAQGIKY